MVARALHNSGCYTGAICDHNEEAQYVININEELLQKNGGSWDAPVDIANWDAVSLPPKAILQQHSAADGLKPWHNWHRGKWAVKDPRICLTLPWWLARFPKAKVIWVQRDTDAVVASLMRRQQVPHEAVSNFTEEKARNLAGHYWAAAEKHTASAAHLHVVSYDDLVGPDQEKHWKALYRFAGTKAGISSGYTRPRALETEPALPTEGPLVSVIVPNYNHAGYLPQRVGSVLNQSYKSIEVLLMDDCSTDNSRAVLEDLAQSDQRVQTLFNENNSGSPFAQWQKGAAWAKGKYLWIAESDDFCDLDMLAVHVKALEANEKAVLAYSQSALVNERGAYLRTFMEDYQFLFGVEHAARWQRDFTANGPEEVRNEMIVINTVPNASGALLRKEAFDKVGAPKTKWKLNGDWLFYAALLQHGDVVFHAAPRNKFRYHGQTQRARATSSYGAFDEILAMYRVFEENGWTTAEHLAQARRRVAEWWGGSLYGQDWSMENWRENKRLFHELKKHRPRLGLNMISNTCFRMGGAVVKFLGIKPMAKWIMSRLFPKKFFPH